MNGNARPASETWRDTQLLKYVNPTGIEEVDDYLPPEEVEGQYIVSLTPVAEDKLRITLSPEWGADARDLFEQLVLEVQGAELDWQGNAQLAQTDWFLTRYRVRHIGTNVESTAELKHVGQGVTVALWGW